MGLFSYECTNCGSHEQFDWTDDCIVGLKKLESNELIFIKGEYTGYGKVIVTDENDDFHYVFPIQFEQYFQYWTDGSDENPILNKSIIAFDIYCNGKDFNNQDRHCFRDRILSPVYDRISSNDISKLVKWG